MDKKFRRHTKSLPTTQRLPARDYFNTVFAFGYDPLPVTPEKIDAAYQKLADMGQRSALPRRLAWIKALHALPYPYQVEIGADLLPSARRGSAPIASPEAGDYASLEAEIDELALVATRPPTSDCDDHKQYSEASLKRARIRALIVAHRLVAAGRADRGLTLDQLLSRKMQANYIRLAYKVKPFAEKSDDDE